MRGKISSKPANAKNSLIRWFLAADGEWQETRMVSSMGHSLYQNEAYQSKFSEGWKQCDILLIIQMPTSKSRIVNQKHRGNKNKREHRGQKCTTVKSFFFNFICHKVWLNILCISVLYQTRGSPTASVHQSHGHSASCMWCICFSTHCNKQQNIQWKNQQVLCPHMHACYENGTVNRCVWFYRCSK